MEKKKKKKERGVILNTLKRLKKIEFVLTLESSEDLLWGSRCCKGQSTDITVWKNGLWINTHHQRQTNTL